MNQYDPEQITFFAKTDARGQQVPFGIKAKDRTKHVYVIGKTGMGKSTLLENMAVQDIKNGNGLAFIDPHGATAEVLLDYIPEERKQDVLYFAPFDTDNPISFNVMEDVGPDKRHLVVSGLMSVFKKIWVDAWSARMEYILSNTLLALLEFPDSTLLGVDRMLSDKHYRKKVVANITDPAVKSFWVDEFANYNERYMQEAGDAIKNKIGQFTSNPLIRNIVGQPHSSFDLREVMDGGKILIANLSKGLVGEQNANLLGSMLTTRIYLAAMSRADLTAEQLKQMPNFYFYVDEFQSFANSTFADILSEARKYKLNLTIAHQYIEQMEEEVRFAVFGNVGTIISFRVGPFDAEILETIFTPKFLAADIVNLGFAQVYLTLMIDGIGSQPFSAVTLPPIEPPHTSTKQMVIAQSRKQYGKQRSPVEQIINAWHEQSYDEKKLEYEARKAAEVKSGGPNNNGGNGGAERRDNSGGNNRPPSRNGSNGAGPKPNADINRDRPPSSRRDDRSSSSNERNGRRDNGGPQRTNSDRGERDSNGSRGNGKRENSNGKGPAGGDKSVEELRSILRNLVGKDDNKQSSESKSERTKDKEPTSEKSSRPAKSHQQRNEANREAESLPRKNSAADLGSAVAAVTNENVPKSKEETRAPSPDTRASTPPQHPSSSTSQQTQQAHTTTTSVTSTPNTATPAASGAPAVPNQYAAAKNYDDPLAPKKLERMMRVTGGDQSPFK